MKKKVMVLMVLLLCMSILEACQYVGVASRESEIVKKEMKIEDSDIEDPSYANEEDGAEITTAPHPEEDFVGSWVAKSEQAQYLYGNINLTVSEDHTWSGNITDEDFSGKWSYDNTSATIRDSRGIINFNLYYASDGTLLLKNLDDPDISLVLKPVS